MSGNKIQSETSVSKQHVHSNRWVKLRQKWKHRGVVEVNEHHRGYHILNNLRNGIRDLLYNHQNLGPKVELNVDDHRHVIQHTETICGKTYIFSSYASSVFASIRHAVSVSELEFLESIAPSNLPYLEFITMTSSTY
ncbi:hypothetical protein KUTeg_021514 [Tegillarca granosa]|uniref:Uncharacterized protein n=1 Tax=Tegillarca granosa TaxID=220873 RepID=A0ABQ9E913_TEGGR|nr:hypothetical protein KUTeg_021514 [Tegillarca granosa]